MSLTHKYTDFGSLASQSSELAPEGDVLEEIKLQAFENGYQAGWDDAVKAHETDQGKIATDLAHNFQDLSFTFHEAQAKMTKALEPLLDQMVNKLLPKMARQSLGGHVLEVLGKLAREQTDNAIEIAVSADNLESIEVLLADYPLPPFKITAESALSPGQVYIRAGKSETEINLDEVISGISEALTAFFHETKKETAHG